MKVKQVEGPVYTSIFDARAKNWHEVTSYNLVFLRTIQRYMNDILRTRGHVFLNDVYDQLGFKRTPDGAITGWIYGAGFHNYISFGNLAVSQGTSIPLEFNVDGIMYDKI
jgi:hypothetical protein